MDDQVPAPAGPERASVARVYDYYLGGDRHCPVDREFAEQMIGTVPEAPEVARLNRAFLRRAVRYCAQAGVAQFLDIGSGIPATDPVHELAGAVRPGCRVAYVDNDHSAVTAGREVLAGHRQAAIGLGDLREPDAVLALPEVRRLVRFAEPVAVLMLGVLHYLADAERPGELVWRYLRVLAPGSFLVISHGTDEGAPHQVRPMVDLAAARQTAAFMRTRREVAGFLSGLEPVPPGVVFLPDWRPEPGDEPGSANARVMAYAAVGRKRPARTA